MIQLSQAAASEIRRLKSKQKQPLALFRLAVKPGGCAGGWYYDMSFDEAGIGDLPLAAALRDRVFDEHGIQVVVDTACLDYINGLVLDYAEDLMGGGFRFHNPQALTSCGCGNSFSTEMLVPQTGA